MNHGHARASEIKADLPLPFGGVRLVHNCWQAPIDVIGVAATHHLELTTLPRSPTARACFPEFWGPHRFERLGDVFLLPAGHRVHARSDCREQVSIACRYEPAALANWLGEEPQWTEDRLRGGLDVASADVRALLARIGEELRHPGFASGTLLELMAGQAAVLLFRHLQALEERHPLGGLSARRLRLIDERLAQDGAPPSLEELAQLCQLSVRQLTRAFRSSRGRSLGSVIAERRMAEARRLLASGLQVKAVAYATGFTAPSNFAAAFLRMTGETPRQYRERASRSRTAMQRSH